jgi:hypothetical protein
MNTDSENTKQFLPCRKRFVPETCDAWRYERIFTCTFTIPRAIPVRKLRLIMRPLYPPPLLPTIQYENYKFSIMLCRYITFHKSSNTKRRFCWKCRNDIELVRFEVFTAVVMKSIVIWDVTPCSLLSCNRPPACLLVLAEIISSALKMEATRSSETSVATQQTTRRHIPEDK